MILPVVLAPNSVLLQTAEIIENIDDALIKLLENMSETMYKRKGIGLAAPQVNKSIRAIIVDVEQDGTPPYVMINPKILSQSDSLSSYDEGCLSYPKQFVKVFRPTEIEVSYTDIGGKEIMISANSLLATCLQHEIDHLNGKTIIDYVSSLLLREDHLKQAEKIKNKMINGEDYI